MAGIDGGVGGLRPGSTGPLHGTDRPGESQGPQKPGSDNLSVSRTDGQTPAARSTPMAGIPAPNPEVANLLANMDSQDLQALLAGLNEEVSQAQQETAQANAQAKKDEVHETQEARKAELESLGTEKAEAQKEAQCVDVKQTFASIFSLGLSQLGPWHQEQSEIKAVAQQKINTIEMQETGMLPNPAPQLDSVTQELSTAFFSYTNDTRPDIYAKDNMKGLIDQMFLDNKIDRDTQVEMRAQLESADGPDDFFRTAMLGASQDAAANSPDISNNINNKVEIPQQAGDPATPDSIGEPVAKGAGAPASSDPANDMDDAQWLNNMSAMMSDNEEQMNDIIAQLEAAQTSVVSAGQDGNALAAMRFTNI